MWPPELSSARADGGGELSAFNPGRQTGPLAWSSAVGEATWGQADGDGCANRARRARTPLPGECARAGAAALRGIFVCGADQWGPRGRQEPAWMCGGIRHWDCREFVSEGRAKGSYRHQLSGFFNVSAL